MFFWLKLRIFCLPLDTGYYEKELEIIGITAPFVLFNGISHPLDTGQGVVSYINAFFYRHIIMASQTISRDTPLAEITLRKYEKPYLPLDQRELVRKLCLSTGLLQPGDSRDIVVDIFHALLLARQQKKELRSDELQKAVVELRRNASLSLHGVASSNIRRQLKRLRDLFLVEKISNKYRINEHEELKQIFEEKIEQYLLQTVVGRVRDYIDLVDKTF